MDTRLKGKVAIVTGAGSGIGKALARRLAQDGAAVVISDIKGFDTAAAEIAKATGARTLGLEVDVSRESDVERMAAETMKALGRIDILVNNAALLGGRGVLDESSEYFTRAVLVAALGNFLNTKHVARSMCERGIRGSIVCISSSNGWTASPGVIAYAFHKGGVIDGNEASLSLKDPEEERKEERATGDTDLPELSESAIYHSVRISQAVAEPIARKLLCLTAGKAVEVNPLYRKAEVAISFCRERKKDVLVRSKNVAIARICRHECDQCP